MWALPPLAPNACMHGSVGTGNTSRLGGYAPRALKNYCNVMFLFDFYCKTNWHAKCFISTAEAPNL
jgi:hypothetical protein